MGTNENDLKWIYTQWDTQKLQQALSVRRGDYTDAALSLMEAELKTRSLEPEVQCPHCGQINPASATQCSCGYNFSNISQEEDKKIQQTFRSFKANKKIADESLCGICKSTFSVGETLNQCEKCLSFYHTKCWEESGGCNQPGVKKKHSFVRCAGRKYESRLSNVGIAVHTSMRPLEKI